MHGHTYRLTIFVEDALLQPEGWVMDFGDLKAVIKPVVNELDHHCLNDIAELENPTCEILAAWIWKRIKPALPGLSRLELKETPTSGVIYEGK